MDSTNADFHARRAQRDQGTRDLCNPEYIRKILAAVRNVQNEASLNIGQDKTQTSKQGVGK